MTILSCGKEDTYQDDANRLVRLYSVIKSIKANPNEGIGKPERLKNDLSGFSSRRIDDEHRIVYQIVAENKIEVIRCRGHYS